MKTRPDKIARRYGGVLFELAQKNNELKVVLKDLGRLQVCIEAEPREWQQVISPSLPLYTQRRLIEGLLSSLNLGDLVSHFLMTLCENRRLPHLMLMLEEFLERTKRAEGIVDGLLETPVELQDKEIKDLEKSLKAQLGQTIRLHQEIKENLLGGVVLRIESLMIDGSLKTHLYKLKMAMKG